MKLYKVLNEDGSAYYGGIGSWPLPTSDGPGLWMPRLSGKLSPCRYGYHLVKREHLVRWLGPAIFEAECHPDSPLHYDDTKGVVAQARLVRKLPWDKRIARLFACDCAEHVLHFFEQKYPHNPHPRNAVDVVRRFANGAATLKELNAAVNAAADAAADAAAYAADAAAYAAVNAAYTAADAVNAAADAANAAYAEREWQTERLFFYLNGGK